MWRRLVFSQLKNLSSSSSSSSSSSIVKSSFSSRLPVTSFRSYSSFLSRRFSTDAGNLGFLKHYLIRSVIIVDFVDILFGAAVSKKSIDDVMPIATGHEREEIEAELQVFIYLFIFCLIILKVIF